MSITFFDHEWMHTCDPVFTTASDDLVSVFQNWIRRFGGPLPNTNRPRASGDHAIAFTATTLYENVRMGALAAEVGADNEGEDRVVVS